MRGGKGRERKRAFPPFGAARSVEDAMEEPWASNGAARRLENVMWRKNTYMLLYSGDRIVQLTIKGI